MECDNCHNTQTLDPRVPFSKKKNLRGTRETVAFFPASRHHKTHEPFVLSYTRKNRIEHAMICLLSSTGSSTKKGKRNQQSCSVELLKCLLAKEVSIPQSTWLFFLNEKGLNRKCRYVEGILLCGAFDLFCKEKLLRSLTRFGKFDRIPRWFFKNELRHSIYIA